MDKEIDFLKINEFLDDYLSRVDGEYFIENAYRFLRLVKSIYENCDYIRDKNENVFKIIDNSVVSLSDGFKLIKEYLSTIDEELPDDFERLLTDGTINIVISEGKETAICKYDDDRLDIEVSGNVVTNNFIHSILHEYMHSFHFSKDKNALTVSYSEFFSIFFELDFASFLDVKLNNGSIQFCEIVSRHNEVMNMTKKLLFELYLVDAKKRDGVVDSYTYESSEGIDESYYYQGLEYMSDWLNNRNDALINDNELPDCLLRYFYGILLSFYLLHEVNKDVRKNVFDMMKMIDKVPLNISLEKLGLSESLIHSINFPELLNRIKMIAEDIININNNEQTL